MPRYEWPWTTAYVRAHTILSWCARLPWWPRPGDIRSLHDRGGLQCFTADDLPIVGAVTETGRLHTLSGLCGETRRTEEAHFPFGSSIQPEEPVSLALSLSTRLTAAVTRNYCAPRER